MQKSEGEEWTVSALHRLLGKYIMAMEMADNESSDVSTPVVINEIVPLTLDLQRVSW